MTKQSMHDHDVQSNLANIIYHATSTNNILPHLPTHLTCVANAIQSNPVINTCCLNREYSPPCPPTHTPAIRKRRPVKPGEERVLLDVGRARLAGAQSVHGVGLEQPAHDVSQGL